MLTQEENDLLTRVEGDAPMGRLMRENYWFPFALSSQLVADGAPKRVRLLGREYAAFRAGDGRVGVFDERCPHRGASLMLARNEDNALRCIFHGWKFDVSGKVVEITTEPVNPEAFAARVKLKHHPTHEAGGLAWVWLGSGAAGRFPELPFAHCVEPRLWTSVSLAPCNWLQGVEGTLDSVHVGTLHHTWIERVAQKTRGSIGMALNAPPRYEVENTGYGLRAAALRPREDGTTYLRVTEYLAPFVSLVPSQQKDEGNYFIVAPVDDTHHLLFYGFWSESRDMHPVDLGAARPGLQYDPVNFAPLPGGRDNNWGQDRLLMAAGHFTGFGNSILEEDMVVQASMGPIADRSEEHLSASDVAVVRARRMLLEALRRQETDELPPGSALARDPASVPMPIDTVLAPGMNWQDFGFDRQVA